MNDFTAGENTNVFAFYTSWSGFKDFKSFGTPVSHFIPNKFTSDSCTLSCFLSSMKLNTHLTNITCPWVEIGSSLWLQFYFDFVATRVICVLQTCLVKSRGWDIQGEKFSFLTNISLVVGMFTPFTRVYINWLLITCRNPARGNYIKRVLPKVGV